jgi:tRNA threonylcarbamoyladenosine biosynthesis protein TsaE
LYAFPVDILLAGPLGAGKTSFLQGFAAGLGIQEPVSSPTYALEQRYATASGKSFLHLDLYRLSPAQAAQLVHTTDDHEGIRCIEWAERLEQPTGHAAVSITLSERNDGREARIVFDDVDFPTEDEIESWMNDVQLPAHVQAHCKAVADLCVRLAEHLHMHGCVVRTAALHRAGLAHDLLRFVDFHPDAAPQGHERTEKELRRWEEIRTMYPDMRHEEACAVFLRAKGYGALADIVAVHGLQLPMPSRVTIEQQILFYADKRVALDRVVSVDERFADFRARYGAGKETDQSRIWHAEAKAVERELFPDGPPF